MSCTYIPVPVPKFDSQPALDLDYLVATDLARQIPEFPAAAAELFCLRSAQVHCHIVAF